MAYLLVNCGDEKGTRIDLPESGDAIIGRSSESCNVVVNSGTISGRHCSMSKSDAGFTLKDLGSTNGTKVNEKIISEERVHRGDKLSLGDFEVILMGDDVPEGAKPFITPSIPVSSSPIKPYADESATGMQISPRTVTSQTVKVIPASFRKKSSHGKVWIAIIVVSAILVIYLVMMLFKTMSH